MNVEEEIRFWAQIQGDAQRTVICEPHRVDEIRAAVEARGYDAFLTQWFDISMNSHQCGTVVAGTDPATSVLDPWCRAHEVENLWVIDGGFFPSSAAMNPALTIAAQALRAVAESDLAGV